MKTLIEGAVVVSMNPEGRIGQENVLVEDDKIAYSGNDKPVADRIIDGKDMLLIPGLVQTHVHLPQTLFRGQADDMELLTWLKKRIWPLEGAHNQESLYYSALLGLGELLLGGTTAIVDLETVHHTASAFEAIRESGIRAITGKVMMDYGDDVPSTLRESTADSLQQSVDLLEKWHLSENGRIQYAFSPRFVLSCSEELLKEIVVLSSEYGVKIHTHASENKGEIALVEKDRGMRNILYFDHLGLASPDLILAHCIWVDDEEFAILKNRQVKVVHCPSCNFKLASGVAPIPRMLAEGIHVSLGADGAPCNNNLDLFQEMRMAALMQKPLHGPTVMPAREVFRMATMGGAEAMGLEKEIGSIEVGKKADLVLISLKGMHANPVSGVDPYSLLVYSLKSSDVELTMVDGQILMEGRELKTIEQERVVKKANELVEKLKIRAGIS
ncbi:MAG TPA: 5'-deoxyadenosine deaminase [Candidatus Limnocylindrales bacterium]|nr:5'-deoxyadenosine deaminase [Candidatus Limnocylindrales bacterium]